jgi:hypothetical protein
MNGYDFEEYCHSLFAYVYKCRVQQTSFSNDEGRDLIMYDEGKTTFIECKNWKTTHVGRPVIQKLHSAMITGKADRGIVVTTGKFTQDATEYVRINGLNIELIDFYSLQKLAAKKGDVLTWDRKTAQDYNNIHDYNEARSKQYYEELKHEHPNYSTHNHLSGSSAGKDSTRSYNEARWKQYYAELDREHPYHPPENRSSSYNSGASYSDNESWQNQNYTESQRSNINPNSRTSTSRQGFDRYFGNGVLLSIIIPGGGFFNPTHRTDMSENVALVLGITILLTFLVFLILGLTANKLFYVGAIIIYFCSLLYDLTPVIRKHRK